MWATLGHLSSERTRWSVAWWLCVQEVTFLQPAGHCYILKTSRRKKASLPEYCRREKRTVWDEMLASSPSSSLTAFQSHISSLSLSLPPSFLSFTPSLSLSPSSICHLSGRPHHAQGMSLFSLVRFWDLGQHLPFSPCSPPPSHQAQHLGQWGHSRSDLTSVKALPDYW